MQRLRAKVGDWEEVRECGPPLPLPHKNGSKPLENTKALLRLLNGERWNQKGLRPSTSYMQKQALSQQSYDHNHRLISASKFPKVYFLERWGAVWV